MGDTVRRQGKMHVSQGDTPIADGNGKQLTYDELKNLVYQYKNQVDYLTEQNKQLNYQGMLHQLTFMFKVLEYPSFFSKEYVNQCSELIVQVMALPKEILEDTVQEPVKE